MSDLVTGGLTTGTEVIHGQSSFTGGGGGGMTIAQFAAAIRLWKQGLVESGYEQFDDTYDVIIALLNGGYVSAPAGTTAAQLASIVSRIQHGQIRTGLYIDQAIIGILTYNPGI
jgi:hypothetical protein